MSERKTVPVAYVTKWATTAGIRIIRDATVMASGALSKGSLYASANDWTEDKAEDKAEAEARYRSKIGAACASAERKLKKLEALYTAPPKYTEG